MKIAWIHCLVALIVSAAGTWAAESYVVADNQTGQILASKAENEKLQVASLTKVATAMVVLDWAQLNKVDLGQMVTVPASALNVAGANPVGLQAGDVVSLRDLLYCALMASDNVAATALAYTVGSRLPNAERLDPVGNFVAHMNALARQLNMKRTLFLNPSGYDSYGEGALPYSTAADIARLTRYAYSEADFPFYVSQKTRTVHVFRGGVDTPVELRNTNELLGQDDIDGVKTGQTSKAGGCLILTSDRRPEVQRDGSKVLVTPRRIIVVLLGSRERFGEGLALVRRGWLAYDGWAQKGRPMKKSEAL